MYNAVCLYVGIRFLHGCVAELSSDWFLLDCGMSLVCCDYGSPSLLAPVPVFRMRPLRLSFGLLGDGS